MVRKLVGRAALLTALLVLFLGQVGYAQNANATIRGTVTDQTGAVLPHATVALVNEGTAHRLSTETNQDGYYTFTALGPGNYEVDVTAQGFGQWKGMLTLRAAQEAVINAALKPGSVTTNVTVTDVTPAIDAANGMLSDVKNATLINAIPVHNSDFRNILAFSPGVTAHDYGGIGAGYTRVNGIPGGSITYQIDGQTANDRFTNDLQLTAPPLQSIQELTVVSAEGAAEFGTPGVVNIVTKSGTNQFHGQVRELYQTGGLEAQGYNALTSHLVHNEFGGALGGPVWIPKLYNGHDKTFFFFDVEKQIQHELSQYLSSVPQTDWEQGDFSDYVDQAGNPVTIYDPMTGVYDPETDRVVRQPFPGNKIPASRINPIAKKIMSYMPKPNANVSASGVVDNSAWNGGYDYVDPNSFATDNITRYTGKVDQLLGKNLLSARYTYTDEPQTSPDVVDGSSGGLTALLNPRIQEATGHNGVISFTSPVGTHMVNEARLGVQLFNSYSGPKPQPGLTASLGLPVYPGNIAWPGFYWFDNNQPWTMALIDRDNPRQQPNQDIDLGDNFSWIRGRHEMKFGFQVINTRVNTEEAQSPGGDYQFDGNFTSQQAAGTSLTGTDGPAAYGATDTGAALADLLLGNVDLTQFNQVPVFHTRQTDYDGYAEDNWKLNSKFTLNVGIRYEYWSPYKDAGGLSSTMDFNKTANCSIPATLAGSGPTSCVSAGTPGYPSWFAQSSPIVVIPDHGSGQSQLVISGNKAAGLPLETASQAGLPASLWNMPKNNWAPRLGFAWQVTRSTVIRGGYGLYYWTMPLVEYHQATRDDVPWAAVIYNYTDSANSNSAELAFPFGPSSLANQCNCTTLPGDYKNPRELGLDFVGPSLTNYYENGGISNKGGWEMAPWDPNYRTQRAGEWNLTVERALPGNWAAQLSYIGNRATNLVDQDPVNAALPRAMVPASVANIAADLRPYPIYRSPYNSSNTNEMRYVGYSNHNAIRGELNHTFKGSYMLQTYFSYARTLGTSGGSLDADNGLQLPPAALTNNAPLSQRLKMVYAPDSALPNMQFVIDGHYELPIGRGKQFLSAVPTGINEVVSGWNASLFYMWHSGLYFAPYYDASPGTGNAGNKYVFAPGAIHPRGVLPKGQRTRSEWFDASIWDPAAGPYNGQTFMVRDNNYDWDYLNGIPRDYMTGPGFSNADGTLAKLTPIGEHVKFDLEMQVFNVFNHTNLGLPGNNGKITSGIGQPRLLQFQGKIIF